jgi:hypothetical protein
MNQYKRGFTAIYGFTSDQQGIRHALLEKDKHQLLRSIGRGAAGARRLLYDGAE